MRWLKSLWPTFIPAPWDIWSWGTLYGPAIVAGIAMITGLFQEIKLMWVIMASGLTFAGFATGAVRFTEWRQMQRVQDKLSFSHVRFVKNIRGEGMALGFVLANNAVFPIEFELVHIRSKIGDQVPAKDEFKVRNITISPGGQGWFNDHIVALRDIPKPGVLEGEIEFEVRYGKPGQLRHALNDKKAAILAFDESGIFERGSWNNAI